MVCHSLVTHSSSRGEDVEGESSRRQVRTNVDETRVKLIRMKIDLGRTRRIRTSATASRQGSIEGLAHSVAHVRCGAAYNFAFDQALDINDIH